MAKPAPPQPRPRVRPADAASEPAQHANASHESGAGSGFPLFVQRGPGVVIQAKRLVNDPGDPFEQEADAIADRAARRPEPGARDPYRQRAAAASSIRAPATTAVIAPPDGGTPLGGEMRARVEPILGADLSGVRVHDSPAARQTADALHARAFTHQNHIWLGSNERADDPVLVAHEATHVVHQSIGGESATGTPPAIQRQADGGSPSPVAPPSAAATLSTPAATGTALMSEADGGTGTPPAAETLSAVDTRGEAAERDATAADVEGTGTGGGPAAGPADRGGGRAGGGDGGGGEPAVIDGIGDHSRPAVPETAAGNLETGDLVLIDVELAEHQRWEGALGRVGAAGSVERAAFIAEQAGSGFISGAASGLAMGLGIGLVTKAVPALGPIIGGGLALHGLVTRDWAETGATIGRFGEGSDTYQVLANSIASVSAVIDIVSQVLTVINGIVGIVQAAAAIIAGGAVVAAFFTFGATLGIAAVAADVVGVCEEISLGISAVTSVLDEINAAILQPCVLLFTALHEYTSQADPREVEAQGERISTAAAASGAALGAWAGGRAAHIGGGAHPSEDLPPTQRPAHETPPPAAGEGPTVHFQEPPIAPEHGGVTPAPGAAPEPLHVAAPVAPEMPAPTVAATHPEAAPVSAPPVIPESAAQALPHPEAITTPQPASEAPHGLGTSEAAPEPVATAATPDPARPTPQPEQLSLPGVDMTPTPAPAAPTGPQRAAITPDVEIRGEFNDSSLRVLSGENTGPAQAGDIGLHRHQGDRGPSLISEHVVPGAQMRDASVDPAHGNAPDWQRSTPSGKADGADYRGATTIVEHSAVSARKTTLDNAETAALQARGGPRNPVTDELLPSLQRHQQAVDDAITAGEITPQQATDPTHRALAAQAELWGRSEATGGAKARADAQAAGTKADLPRRVDSRRDAEAARARARLASEHIEEPDWDATFMNPNRQLPVGTQLEMPSMEGTGPRRAPEQLSLNLPERAAPNPNQLSLALDTPATTNGGVGSPSTLGSGGIPPTPIGGGAGSASPGGGPTPAQRILVVGAERPAEFQYAREAAARGHDVTVVNPQATPESEAFAAQGGRFVNAGIETLPQRPGYHVIGEDFPVPIRGLFPRAQQFAAERVSRLEPGGRWVVATEAPEFVTVLELVGRQQGAQVTTHQVPRHHEATPDSPHLQDRTRFIVIVEAPAMSRPEPTPAPTPTAPAAPSAPATSTGALAPGASSAASHPTITAAPRPIALETPAVTTAQSPGLSASVAAQSSVAVPTANASQPPPSVSWGTRAHQVGELFLPQIFGAGGHGPTHAEKEAAHRARFTQDNQPAEGVERVNPEYPAPPGTPAQITAIQNEVMNLLTVRATAEREAQNESQRAEQCEANRSPIRQTIADTNAGISAVQAHDGAIARREAANQEQQRRQQESQGLVSGYPSRATGLGALTVPLAAWEGFTSLASHLPGDAGDSMMRMNREARQMQDSFAQMAAQMLGVDGQEPAQQAGLQNDQQRLETTGEQADASDQHLQTSSEGADGLKQANDAAHAEARRRQHAATDRAGQCTEAATEREEHATSLAEQLRVWANAHAAARQQAIANTTARLEGEGRIVAGVSER